MTLRNFLFTRAHRKACAATLASEAARELARSGVEKRRRTVREMAQEMRRQMNLPEDPRLA